MSDYTPTTDEVREVWQYDQQEVDMEGWVTVSFDEAGQSFDRWLTAHDAEVVEHTTHARPLPTRDEIARAIYDALSGKYGDFNMPHDAADAVLSLLKGEK